MIALIQEVWADISSGKHIDTYILILVNLAGVVLTFFDVISPQVQGSVILLSLSWLVANVFSERKVNESRSAELVQHIDRIEPTVRAESFFTEGYVQHSSSFYYDFDRAHELSVIGQGQGRMIDAHTERIQRILRSGGRVRFILLDPNGEGLRMAVQRGTGPHRNIDGVRNEHWDAISRLAGLASGAEGNGILEIRFIDILMYTMYGFNFSDEDNDSAYIWMTPFRRGAATRPGFKLTRNRDGDKLDYFKGQFNAMWDCELVKPYNLGS